MPEKNNLIVSKVEEEEKIDVIKENEGTNTDAKLRGKKKLVNTIESMDDAQNIEELREVNEKETKKNDEKADDGHKKCGCNIF